MLTDNVLGRACFINSISAAASITAELSAEALEKSLGLLNKAIPVGTKYCVAGGCFRSLFHKEPVKDIDIYVLGNYNEAILTMKAIAQTLSDPINLIMPDLNSDPFDITCIENAKIPVKTFAVNMRNGWKKRIAIMEVPSRYLGTNNSHSVQFMASKFENLDTSKEINLENAIQVIDSFDHIAISMGVEVEKLAENDYSIVRIIEHPKAIIALARKEMIFNNRGYSDLKHMSIKRFYKYVHDYNFSCSAENLTLFKDILFTPIGLNEYDYV